MQTVFTKNSMVAHVWAQQNQSHGRTKNMFFEDRVIYSYTSRWPIAFFVEPECTKFIEIMGVNVVINNGTISNTTRQHKANVVNALWGSSAQGGSLFLSNRDVVCDLIDANGDDNRMLDILIEYFLKEYIKADMEYKGLLKQYNDDYRRAPRKFLVATEYLLENARRYNNILNRGFIPSLSRCMIVNAEIESVEQLREQIRQNIAIKKEQKVAVKKARQLDEHAALMPFRDAAIKTWRDCKEHDAEPNIRKAIKLFVYNDNCSTQIRYRTGNIETSRGAEVSLYEAKKLIRSCQNLVPNPETKLGCYRPHPTMPINVGSFSVTYVDFKNKYIKIGCHELTFDAINDFIGYAAANLDIDIDMSYKMT